MWRMSEVIFLLYITPLLWSTVRERALAKGFSFNMEDAKYQCICRRTRLKFRDRQRSQRMCDYDTCGVLCLFSFMLLPKIFPAESCVRIQCCFMSTETVRIRDREPKTGHLDFDTAPEL